MVKFTELNTWYKNNQTEKYLSLYINKQDKPDKYIIYLPHGRRFKIRHRKRNR